MTRFHYNLLLFFFLLFGIYESVSCAALHSSTGIDHYSILKKTGSYTGEFSNSYLKSVLDGTSKEMNWNLELTFNKPEGGFEWGNKEIINENDKDISNFIGNLHFADRSITSSLSLFNSSNFIGGNVTYTDYEIKKDDWLYSVMLQPVSLLSAGVTTGTKSILPSTSDLFYQYISENEIKIEGGTVFWNTPVKYENYTIRIIPFPSIEVTYNKCNYFFAPQTVRQYDAPGNSYEGQVNGKAVDKKIHAVYQLKEDHIVTFGFHNIVFDGDLDMFDAIDNFGHFGVATGDFEQRSVQLLSGDRKIAVSYGSFEGELKGTIEAKPFVDGLLGFLGERRHFVGEGKLNWYSMFWSDKILSGKRHNLFLSTSYFMLKPAFRYVTWRPLFFGFGVDDLRTDELDITQADLFCLKLSSVFDVSDFRLNLQISQFIPLWIKKENRQPSTSGSPDPGPIPETTSTSNSNKTTGGFNLKFYIDYNL